MGLTGNYPHQTQSIWKVLKRRTLETWIDVRLTRVHHKNTLQNFSSSWGEKWNEKKNQLKINQGRNVVTVGNAGPSSRKKIPCPCGMARFPVLLTKRMKSCLRWPTMTHLHRPTWAGSTLWRTPQPLDSPANTGIPSHRPADGFFPRVPHQIPDSEGMEGGPDSVLHTVGQSHLYFCILYCRHYPHIMLPFV